MTATVALVDDQDLVRTGFRMILSVEDDIELVGEAADGLAATKLVEQLSPDVVLMDVQMPTMDGIEATRRIVASSDTRVVILTTFERDDYLFAALDAGASGFLLKSCSADELVAAIRNVAEGHALLAPKMTRSLIERFTAERARESAPRTTAVAEPGLDELTDRERDVLVLIAEGRSNAEIAEELVVGTATVKTHVSRILTKLGLRDRVQAVVLAYRSGLVRPPQG
ncbi:MAG TPA: response regulator transcription factor [Nocardioides sp.]|nr:response regulator transcription factor [uncultured Nocardioides sp.]HEX5987003.1 response regulator transcription factor [Nocardioides sp.]